MNEDNTQFVHLPTSDADHKVMQRHFKALQATMHGSASAIIILFGPELDYKLTLEVGNAVIADMPIIVFHPLDVAIPDGLMNVADAVVTFSDDDLTAERIQTSVDLIFQHWHDDHHGHHRHSSGR